MLRDWRKGAGRERERAQCCGDIAERDIKTREQDFKCNVRGVYGNDATMR